MTDLDRRVAKWRGWTWDSNNEWWIDTDGAVLLGSAAYLPSTNLWQAVALWNEARPEGWRLHVEQNENGTFNVGKSHAFMVLANPVTLTDLPRAIAEAWCETMEARP